MSDIIVDLKQESISYKGIVIPAQDANKIKEAYERICTANYLVDTYAMTEPQAWELASKVRNAMADHPGLTEEDAITELM